MIWTAILAGWAAIVAVACALGLIFEPYGLSRFEFIVVGSIAALLAALGRNDRRIH